MYTVSQGPFYKLSLLCLELGCAGVSDMVTKSKLWFLAVNWDNLAGAPSAVELSAVPHSASAAELLWRARRQRAQLPSYQCFSAHAST